MATLRGEGVRASASTAGSNAASAGRSAVSVRALEAPAEMTAAAGLAARVWKSHDTSQLDASLLRALAHTGNFVAGAFDGGALVGLSVGFLTATPAYGLHSHMTCTVDGRRDRGLGAALKSYQRTWALSRDLTSITWTFDPLVRRNAYFNITKLGARVQTYLPDFYGPMLDGLNVGDQSDRLLMTWALTEGGPRSEVAAPRDLLLRVGPGDGPSREEVSGDVVGCEVPTDIVALRERDPGLALRWRHQLREALSEALSHGYVVDGFTRSGCYVLARGQVRHEASAADG